MIATGASNVKLFFSSILLASVSIAYTTMNCGNASEMSDKDSSAAETPAAQEIAEDTSFVVKAIKFHQQQVMLTDIADKKLTDTALKRIASQIRINHQTSLGELFKVYKSADSLHLSRSEKNWNDSLIADRTNDLSKEEEKISDLNENSFKNRWINLMIKEYDHIIPEYEAALKGTMSEKMRTATNADLTKIKENREDLLKWKSGGNASR